MRSSTLLSLPLLALLAGCPPQGTSGPTPVPTPVPAEPSVTDNYSGIADEMCACQDDPCRQAATAKLKAFADANGQQLAAADQAVVGSIGERAAKCSAGASGGGLVAEFSAISDKMCACTDKACAQGVQKELDSWLSSNQNAKGSPEEQEKAKGIAARFTKCMTTAMGGDSMPGVGMKCGEADACAAGLECVKYYGIAGKRGGELTSCERKCGNGLAACGDGLKCTTIADGPGQVCRAPMQLGRKPGMGQKCGVGDACAAGLECVKYYGIAGKRGGEFTSCERKCGSGLAACGDGHQCTTIADGPGQVCRKK